MGNEGASRYISKTSDRSKRHAIITAAVLLHNFRTEFVGLNQIAQVFDPEYERLRILAVEWYV
jgi:hypothetical protein